MHVRASACYPLALAAQHVATPTMNTLNFREESFVIRSQIMKFTKILCHKNLELYGITITSMVWYGMHWSAILCLL